VRFDQIRPVLLGLVASCVGVRAVWDDVRRPFVPPVDGVIALCRLNVSAAIGVDERRMTYDPDAAPDQCLSDTINGTRRATLTVQVMSFDQDDVKQALGYLETLRTRFASQRVRDALNAVNCALWSTGQVVPLNAPVDDHIASIGALDIFLGLMINESDLAFSGTADDPGAESPVTYGPIDQVVITNQVANPPVPPEDFEVNAP
jgi:hypothetical protein